MKKKIYLVPSKNTKYDEYYIIKKGKIREVFYYELVSDHSPQVQKFHNIIEDKYKRIDNVHSKFKLRKLDSLLSKRFNKPYNYEVTFNAPKDSSNLEEAKIFKPNAEWIYSKMFPNRRIYIKLSFWEKWIIDYHLFSWSKLTITHKLTIITIIITAVIGISAIIFTN